MTAELHLFGGAALHGADGQPVSGAAAQPRRLAVLAVLADAWPAPVTRDRLVGLLWPEQDDAGARRLLTQALYALRRELGDFTSGSGRDLRFDPDALRVDLLDFRRAVAGGDMLRAATLYRGPLLDGVHVRGAVEFERWVESVREATRRQFQAAVEQVVAAHGAAGEWREAARWAGRMVREAPYDSGATLRLVECWLAAGDRGAALAAATAYERRVRSELEIEPDPVVRQGIRTALRAAAAAAAAEERVERPASTAAELPAPADSPPPAPPPEDGETAGAAPPPLRPPADAPSTTPSGPTPLTPPPSQGSAPRRRATWLIGPALAVGLAGLVLFAGRSTGTPSLREVTVTPFEVRGDSGFTDAGSVVAQVLAASLDGSGGAAVAAARAAGGQEAWGEIRGEIVAAGAQVRIDAELLTGENGLAAARAVATGPRDSLLALAERIAVQLAPGFYPVEVRQRLGVRIAGEFRSAGVLRRHLDGEAALRRAAWAEAHRHFTAATGQDSTRAWSWFRRAFAAEQAHRNDDADLSLEHALRFSSALPERERLRLEAYALWRRGDAVGAEQLYRRLLTGDPQDREAWFGLAELLFHAGPLHGRPLVRARDAWDRVVAQDSGDVAALTHALRLHAHARDHEAVDRLLRRAVLAGAAGAPLAEAEVIAAFARGEPHDLERAARVLDTIPEYSLQFLQGVVAGTLGRPAAARTIAARMVHPERPVALQGQGYVALAHLALAEGRWREAMIALDSAERRNPVAAAWTRALFVSLPYVRADAADVREAERSLDAVPALGASPPLYLQIGVAIPAASVIQPYLETLLMREGQDGRPGGRPGTATAGLRCTAAAGDWTVQSLCGDLRRGLEAEVAQRAGRPGVALEALQSLELRVPYQYAGRSAFFARSRERFHRAMLLESLGHDAEAEAWYEAAPHGAWSDYILLAPAMLGRARIRERAGDRSGAEALYRGVLSLWPEPDPELAAIVREARAGLTRTARPG